MFGFPSETAEIKSSNRLRRTTGIQLRRLAGTNDSLHSAGNDRVSRAKQFRFRLQHPGNFSFWPFLALEQEVN